MLIPVTALFLSLEDVFAILLIDLYDLYVEISKTLSEDSNRADFDSTFNQQQILRIQILITLSLLLIKFFLFPYAFIFSPGIYSIFSCSLL